MLHAYIDRYVRGIMHISVDMFRYSMLHAYVYRYVRNIHAYIYRYVRNILCCMHISISKGTTASTFQNLCLPVLAQQQHQLFSKTHRPHHSLSIL